MEHLAEKASLSLFQVSLVKVLRSANRYITHQAATHQLIYLFNGGLPDAPFENSIVVANLP
jgi:hypothetical protein